MFVVLMALSYKACCGLSLQSQGSRTSQNPVTSGIPHCRIMLCDPGGNGWWTSQHWDVSDFNCIFPVLFFFFCCVLHDLSDPFLMRAASPPNLGTCLCTWVATDPSLRYLPCFHQFFLLYDPIYYWKQPSTNPPPKPPMLPKLQAESKPQDPCPHRRTWIMHAVFQLDAGFAVTYITPIALSILCDFPLLADASAHTFWFKKAVKRHQKLQNGNKPDS